MSHVRALGVVGLATMMAAGARAQNPYVVGPNVQVSRALGTVRHYETQIAADPEQVNHLVAGAYVVRADGSADNVFYVSFDRGVTWAQALTVTVGTDPACAIGLKGTAFAASIHDIARPDGNSDSFLVVQRSADGGRTWRASTVEGDTRSLDRNYVTVDDRRGRVYVHGYLQDPRDSAGKRLPSTFAFYVSADGGRTFAAPILRQSTGPGTPKFVPANGVVMPDGTFVALVAELDATKLNMFRGRSDEKSAPDLDGTLTVVRSADGGRTLEPASLVADVYYDWRVPQLSMSSLAVDRSGGPFNGRLYAAWPDARLDRHTQIFLSYSTDAGRTWGAPRVVSDDKTVLNPGDRPNHFMPMVAVNKDGVVGVSWYDRRDNPDNLGYWPRFATSLDGGASWLPSVRVSTAPNVAEPNETRFNSGDTAGLVADAGGVFHPLWIDNRTGVYQMWTAPVTVHGTAHR